MSTDSAQNEQNQSSKGILESLAEKMGIKEDKNKEQRLDERETTKVEEEALRRFSHASKTVWKMDREA